ncbi:MAG: hypothetical protein ACPGQL_04660 [Thermoplasmatota archaeon]
MRPSFLRDQRAASEIVGALMLIVIVTAAAAGLGAFVLDQQQATQEAERANLARSLEKLQVTGIEPVDTDADGDWDTLTFQVANLHADPSELFHFTVNGEVAINYTVTRTVSGSPVTTDGSAYTLVDPLDIQPSERLEVAFDLTNTTDKDFPAAPVMVTTAQPITLELFTGYQNTFERTFIPPTAIPVIRIENVDLGTGYSDVQILDGSLSDHPLGTAIVAWDWAIDQYVGAPDGDDYTEAGRKVAASDIDANCDGAGGNLFDVTLTVTDRYGMKGSDIYTGYDC